LKESGDRFQKTIVFCVDQEHAARMRQALINENADVRVGCGEERNRADQSGAAYAPPFPDKHHCPKRSGCTSSR